MGRLWALLIASLASPAAAQPDTGSRINRAPLAVTSSQLEAENAAIRVMNQFARCVANQRPRAAIALVSLPYLGTEQSASAVKLVGGEEDCLGIGDRELRFKPPLIVGGLAEQLVLANKNKADLNRLSGLTDEALSKSGGAPRTVAEDFAQCVVRRDPKSAADIIRTKPTSKEEAAIIKQVTPHLGPCLISGQTISLTKPAVRSSLAVGLYRLLSVVSQPDQR